MLDTDDDNTTAEAGPDKDPDDETLLRRLKRWERSARTHWSKWREEARQSYDFVAGKQWSAEDKSALLDQMRQPVTFNRVAPMVDAVMGAEILNRQEVRYMPREQGDVQVNEIISAADEWARELADTEDEESDAFADTVICGMGWTESRMDYAEDPEGRIVDDRIDPFEMWSDPQAKKRCIADARFIIRARWRDKDDLPEKWRSKLKDITEGAGNIDDTEHGHTGPRDDYNREDDRVKEPADADKKQLWVRHFQWFDKESVWRVGDPDTGNLQTMTQEELDQAIEAGLPLWKIQDPTTNQTAMLSKQDLKQLGDMYMSHGMKPPKAERQAVKIDRNAYFQAVVAGNTILEQGPIECGHFTFKCITGKRDRNANTFFGVVRAMIDPQMWGNKFFVQVMHILNTAAKGGLMYESGSFVNPRKALDDWSKPDAGIELQRGALSGQKASVQERAPTVFPAGLEKMMEFSLNNLPQTSGINLEMLGLVERDQPGVIEAQRKKAGYAILAVFFDSLRRYRKMKGRVRLYFIQHYISDGRLIRIKGKDSTLQYVPLVKQKDTATYDVIVDDAPMSPNQKEATWSMMQAMMPMLAKLGVPPEIWQVMLEYSPLPSSVSSKINQIISQTSQQAPPPDPKLIQVQAEVEAKKAELQMEAENDQRKAQIEAAQQEQEFNHKERLHQLDLFKAQADIGIAREKAQIEMQRHGASLQAQTVADAQKLHTQQLKDEQAVIAAKNKAAVAAQSKTKAKAA